MLFRFLNNCLCLSREPLPRCIDQSLSRKYLSEMHLLTREENVFLLLITAVLKITWRQSSCLHFRAILNGNSMSVKVLLWYLPRDEAPFYQDSSVLKGLQEQKPQFGTLSTLSGTHMRCKMLAVESTEVGRVS